EGVVTLDRLAAMGRPCGDSSLERQLPLEALLGHPFYARPGPGLAEVSAGHFFMPKEAWVFLRRPLASPPGSSSPSPLGGRAHLSRPRLGEGRGGGRLCGWTLASDLKPASRRSTRDGPRPIGG